MVEIAVRGVANEFDSGYDGIEARPILNA